MAGAKRTLLASLVVLLGLGPVGPAQGAPVSVGRASTTVPDAQPWRIHALDAPSIGIDGGVHGRSETAVTVAWLEGRPGRADAVLVLEGSRNSYGSALLWPATCEGFQASPTMFVRNRWRNLWQESHDDCLIVAGPVALAPSMRREAGVPALLERHGVQLAGAGWVVRATVARQGTWLTVTAYLREPFKGVPAAAAPEPGPSLVPPEVVQWGVDLAAAVRASTLSVSGKFELPPIAFEPR